MVTSKIPGPTTDPSSTQGDPPPQSLDWAGRGPTVVSPPQDLSGWGPCWGWLGKVGRRCWKKVWVPDFGGIWCDEWYGEPRSWSPRPFLSFLPPSLSRHPPVFPGGAGLKCGCRLTLVFSIFLPAWVNSRASVGKLSVLSINALGTKTEGFCVCVCVCVFHACPLNRS